MFFRIARVYGGHVPPRPPPASAPEHIDYNFTQNWETLYRSVASTGQTRK